jgi:hypothetical protein
VWVRLREDSVAASEGQDTQAMLDHFMAGRVEMARNLLHAVVNFAVAFLAAHVEHWSGLAIP